MYVSIFLVQWVITNLRPTGPSASSFSWTFDLDGIAELYQSYEDTNLWLSSNLPVFSGTNLYELLPNYTQTCFYKIKGTLLRIFQEEYM